MCLKSYIFQQMLQELNQGKGMIYKENKQRHIQLLLNVTAMDLYRQHFSCSFSMSPDERLCKEIFHPHLKESHKPPF